MGSVVSALERLVIDTAWTCHEWWYGIAPGSVSCVKPRPVKALRHRCVNNAPSSSSSSSGETDDGPAFRHRLREQATLRAEKPASSLNNGHQLPRKLASTGIPLSRRPPSSARAAASARHRLRRAPHLRDPADNPTEMNKPETEGNLLHYPMAVPATALASVAVVTSASSDDDDDPPPPPPSTPPRRVMSRANSALIDEIDNRPNNRPRRRATMSLVMSMRRMGMQQQHSHHHLHHHHHDDDIRVQRQPKRPNVPYSTLQAVLFRCTAARNGCLSSSEYKDKAYPVRPLGRSWSVHNASVNRAATL